MRKHHLVGIWKGRHYFIGNFGEEAQFYGLFEKESTILLSKFGRRIYVQNYAGGWLEFHFMVQALPGVLVI